MLIVEILKDVLDFSSFRIIPCTLLGASLIILLWNYLGLMTSGVIRISII